jgi:hypothetical protein
MSFTINSPYMLKLKLKHSMINWDDEISQKQVDCLRWGTSTKKPRDGQNLTTKLQMAGLEAQLKQLEVSLNHGKLTFTSDEWERFGIPQTMDSLETIGVGDFIEVSSGEVVKYFSACGCTKYPSLWWMYQKLHLFGSAGAKCWKQFKVMWPIGCHTLAAVLFRLQQLTVLLFTSRVSDTNPHSRLV